jgi:riboflavin synthase
MFTGIIEEIGTIKSIKNGQNHRFLTIQAKKVLEKTKIGDSIATNGVCLTVVQMGEDYYEADVMAESLRRSNLGNLKNGDKVNLERALTPESRMGGHIVSGHIEERER